MYTIGLPWEVGWHQGCYSILVNILFIKLNFFSSSRRCLLSCVFLPQSSILSPTVALVTLHKPKIQHRCCVDDTQIYVPIYVKFMYQFSAVIILSVRKKVLDVPKRSPAKVNLFFFFWSSKVYPASTKTSWLPVYKCQTHWQKNLGVIFDSDLSFQNQVPKVGHDHVFYQVKSIS